MKTIITLSALALISNIAAADSFQYERQLASEDLDPNIASLSAGIKNPVASRQAVTISLHKVYRGNPDTQTEPVEPRSLSTGTSQICSTYDLLIEGNPDLEV